VRIADAQFTSERRSRLRVFFVGTVNAAHVRVTNAAPCLEMKLRYKPTANKSDA
jgi:hypothetical protein